MERHPGLPGGQASALVRPSLTDGESEVERTAEGLVQEHQVSNPLQSGSKASVHAASSFGGGASESQSSSPGSVSHADVSGTAVGALGARAVSTLGAPRRTEAAADASVITSRGAGAGRTVFWK